MHKLSIAQATPHYFTASYSSLLHDDYDMTIPCTHCYMLPTATLLLPLLPLANVFLSVSTFLGDSAKLVRFGQNSLPAAM